MSALKAAKLQRELGPLWSDQRKSADCGQNGIKATAKDHEESQGKGPGPKRQPWQRVSSEHRPNSRRRECSGALGLQQPTLQTGRQRLERIHSPSCLRSTSRGLFRLTRAPARSPKIQLSAGVINLVSIWGTVFLHHWEMGKNWSNWMCFSSSIEKKKTDKNRRKKMEQTNVFFHSYLTKTKCTAACCFYYFIYSLFICYFGIIEIPIFLLVVVFFF